MEYSYKFLPASGVMYGPEEPPCRQRVLRHVRYVRDHILVGDRALRELHCDRFRRPFGDGTVQLLDCAFSLTSLVKSDKSDAL